MSSLVGVWFLTESNNWEQYLDSYQAASGVGYMKRRRSSGLSLRPVLEISRDGNRWTLTMPSSLRAEPSISFTDGEEFVETILDDKKIKCLIKTIGDKKLIEFQKDYDSNLILTTIIREVIGDKLVQTLISSDKVCTRIFKKQEAI